MLREYYVTFGAEKEASQKNAVGEKNTNEVNKDNFSTFSNLILKGIKRNFIVLLIQMHSYENFF